MKQLVNNKAAPRKARTVASIAAALLGVAVLFQLNLVHAAPHGGGGVSTAVDLASSMAADSTAVSLVFTMVSAMATGGAGITAGTTDATAGGWPALD